MIIPYATDAPIYHFPKATLGLIATNVAIHVVGSFGPPETVVPFAMKLGAGLHPLQWVTHNFLHAGIMHLVGNMIFLWAYGIIVEGKIGWLPFLLTYLGIGTAHGALIQVAYLHAATPSYVLGASAIIFGLMAIGMIWAPVNDLSCFYFFLVGLRVISNVVDVPIYVFALLQLALEGLSVGWHLASRGDPISSALLHISGAFWGLLAGILLVKARWVDCEGWDVFSLMKKRRELRRDWEARGARLEVSKANEKLPRKRRSEEDRADVTPEERAAKLLAKVHRAIEAGDVAAAQETYQKWMAALPDLPPWDALAGLIKAMHAQKQWAASVPLMRALCRFYPEKSGKVRLSLASVLIRELGRPTEAQRHLQQITAGSLDPALERSRQDLLKQAAQMIEEGVLEVEEDV